MAGPTQSGGSGNALTNPSSDYNQGGQQGIKESLCTAVLYAKIFDGKDKVYLGPRKIDDSPQATFHYGDGKWVMHFHYVKDEKAAERGGNSQSHTHPEDKKDKEVKVKNDPNTLGEALR